ncbi:probable cytochrome P450 313a4, partial [Uranotaenia lowii]|uniref:probable cytochrome P450 313a4 n=1 Tax=Uranotaenia lowii TaxID=190385 RepID=UPI00247A749A
TGKEDESNIRAPRLFIENLENFLSQSPQLDNRIILDNLNTIIFAATDTSATVASTTLLMLAMHPEVQERVYQEVISVAPSGPLEYQDVSKLEYMEMVIKESMRLVPVVALVGRICEKDLTVGEYEIPAGAEIVIPIIKLHRNKRIWGPNAEEFDPENFSRGNCAKMHPYAFLAFSGGARNCIGMKYAYLTLKIVLANLLQHYRFSTRLKLDELKFHASIVLQIANGHM